MNEEEINNLENYTKENRYTTCKELSSIEEFNNVSKWTIRRYLASRDLKKRKLVNKPRLT